MRSRSRRVPRAAAPASLPVVPRLRLREGSTAWRVVEGETVAIDLGRGEYLTFNPTAAKAWSMLSEGATADELVRAIVGEFEVDPGPARRDLDAFLDELRSRGIIEEAGP